jgi:hypothetical protein
MNVLVAGVLVSTGLAYGYVRYRLDSTRTGSSVGLSTLDGSPSKSGVVKSESSSTDQTTPYDPRPC